MAYNRNNHKKRVGYIMQVYNEVKNEDVPDTRVVKNLLTKHGIYISYRSLMYYKNMKQKDLSPQQSLFQ